MPKIGVEPTLPCGKRILSPPRLPFRHFGIGGSTPSIVRELQLSLKQSGHTSRSVGQKWWKKNTFPLLTLSAIIAELDSLETPL